MSENNNELTPIAKVKLQQEFVQGLLRLYQNNDPELKKIKAREAALIKQEEALIKAQEKKAQDEAIKNGKAEAPAEQEAGLALVPV